ncbi:MAG: class 3 adenylate cyclase [Candidatus Aldehydirespiratoraceae bacterium]
MTGFCRECEAKLPSNSAKFCPECGTPVTDADRPPHQIVSEIVTRREAIGERKFVTVLFSDIKGSTEVAAALDPEDWYLALERFHHAATSSIHEFNGVVTQYAGDGVMALFGAPVADENHAVQAGYAALRLHEQMAIVAKELESRVHTLLGLRVGLNSGEVVVGKIGEGARIDYTAQGMPVHIAARMEQIASVGEIFVGPATVELIASRFELLDMGMHEVKGAPELIHVRRLVRPATYDPNLEVERRPLVGRRDELGRLRAIRQEAAAGRAGTIAVVAPAGQGKSRLLDEFLAELDPTDRVARIGGNAVVVPRPLLGVADLVRALLGLDTAVDLGLASGLERLDASLAQHAAYLEPVLDPSSTALAVDPDLQRRRVETALDAIIEAHLTNERGVLVIAVEDVHALDAASHQVLANLSANRPTGAFVLVATGRPSTSHDDLLAKADLQIELGALSREDIAGLAGAWMADPSDAHDLAAVLHDRTEGNPFFVEEVLRLLFENGVIEGEVGDGRLTGSLIEIDVPPRVQMVVAARIDRLDRPARAVLQFASVLGVEFDIATLEVIEPDPHEVMRLLRLLTDAGLVRPLDEERCAFHHRTTQEVAYDSQLRDRRASHHAAAAAALVERPEPEARASTIAHHYERAGAGAVAARWYTTGARSAAGSDPQESLRLWTKVRDLTTGDDAESVGIALMARAEMLGQGSRTGMAPDKVLATIADARDLAAGRDQQTMLALVLLRGWYGLSGAGLSKQAREISREAMEIADTTGIPQMAVGARLAELSNYSHARPPAEGLALCDEVEVVLVENGLDAPDSMLRIQLDFCRGSMLLRTGRVGESIKLLESAAKGTDAAGDNLWRVVSRVGLIVAIAAGENMDGVSEHAEQAVAIAEEFGGNAEISMARRGAGLAALALGNHATAKKELTEALRISRNVTALSTEEMMLCGLADAERLSGDPSRAAVLAREAIAIAVERGNDNYELMGCLSLAWAILENSDPVERGIDSLIDRIREIIDANRVDLYSGALAEIVARRENLETP